MRDMNVFRGYLSWAVSWFTSGRLAQQLACSNNTAKVDSPAVQKTYTRIQRAHEEKEKIAACFLLKRQCLRKERQIQGRRPPGPPKPDRGRPR